MTRLLFIVCGSRDDLVRMINDDMQFVSSWFYQHRMYPNLAKTKVVSFGYKNPVDLHGRIWLHQSPNCAVGCGCKPLSQVYEIKYLGVMLDNKLTWGAQSKYLQSCLRKLNYVLFYASRQFSKFHLRKIYVALFESRLRYGIINWGAASANHLKPLSVLQKRTIRSVAGLRAGTSTGAEFISLKILNLQQLYRHSAGCYVHKHKSRFGVHEKRKGGLRSGNAAASVPVCRKTHSCNQASFAAAVFYNSLPAVLKGTVVANKFCKDLKEYLVLYE